MNAQLKYGFKKETALLFRRYIFLGIVLGIYGFALSYPFMYKMVATVFSGVPEAVAAIGAAFSAGLGAETLNGIGSMYSNPATVYSLTLTSFASYSLLVIMLVMRSAAGGELVKRTMIVPLCAGLRTKNYLIPKFLIYPLTVFVLSFSGGVTAGFITDALYEENKVGARLILLTSLLIAVYMLFTTTVYLSLGICTQRPGLITGAVFLGQLLLQSMLNAMGLTDYHPFTLLNLAGGEMFDPSFDLSAKTPSILTAVGLSLLISVLMFFLALGVMNAKKINNQEEIKPEF